jgi:hypothetical protein
MRSLDHFLRIDVTIPHKLEEVLFLVFSNLQKQHYARFWPNTNLEHDTCHCYNHAERGLYHYCALEDYWWMLDQTFGAEPTSRISSRVGEDFYLDNTRYVLQYSKLMMSSTVSNIQTVVTWETADTTSTICAGRHSKCCALSNSSGAIMPER